MSLGQLRQFQATRRVLLDDTRWYVTGDRMDYVADTELISVYGRPGQDAYINGLDRKAGRAVEARCPELHVELRTGRLNAPCKIQTSSG